MQQQAANEQAEQQKELSPISKTFKGLVIGDSAVIILLAVQQLLGTFGLQFFIGVYISVVLITAIVFMTGFILFLYQKRRGKPIIALYAMVGTAALTLLCILGSVLLIIISPKAVKRADSPDGAHTVVIMESGFIDAKIEAHEQINALMYRKADNGYLLYHDVWSAKSAEIVWVSDTEAHITMTSAPETGKQGSNADNVIVVKIKQ